MYYQQLIRIGRPCAGRMRVPRRAATAGAGMPGDDLRPEARARTRFPGTAIHWCIWSYWYPREFSAAARAKVAAKKILAGRDFEGKKQSVRWVTEIEAALRTYIFRVFLSFAEEACELGRQGVWGVEQVEREAREFLRLTSE